MTNGMSEVPHLRAVPGTAGTAADHATAVAALFDAAAEVTPRPQISLSVGPSPQRLAPYAFTLLAELADDDADLSGSGRFVLLHDPAGHPSWHGTWRVVSYLRAAVDPEMADDPLLSDVAWSWMSEAWQQHAINAGDASGTVTCTRSQGFGDLDAQGVSAEVEVRCSWTPATDDDGLIDVVSNVRAWLSVLATAAGLEQQ